MNKQDRWVKAQFRAPENHGVELNNGQPVVAFKRDGRIDFWRTSENGFEVATRDGDTNKKTVSAWLASIEEY